LVTVCTIFVVFYSWYSWAAVTLGRSVDSWESLVPTCSYRARQLGSTLTAATPAGAGAPGVFGFVSGLLLLSL